MNFLVFEKVPNVFECQDVIHVELEVFFYVV